MRQILITTGDLRVARRPWIGVIVIFRGPPVIVIDWYVAVVDRSRSPFAFSDSHVTLYVYAPSSTAPVAASAVEILKG